MDNEQLIAESLKCYGECFNCKFFMPCGIKGEVACLKAQTAYKIMRVKDE